MDPNNAQMSDFVCDFCGREWADERPMVEGHQGSLICRECLDEAFERVWLLDQGVPVPDGKTCILCLADNGDPAFEGTRAPGVYACKRCIKQSVVMLERDPDYGYVRPGGRGPS